MIINLNEKEKKINFELKKFEEKMKNFETKK